LGVPSMGVPQNGWLIMGNPINMDDLCVPLWLRKPSYVEVPYSVGGIRDDLASASIPLDWSQDMAPPKVQIWSTVKHNYPLVI
jgi:hypothetical protein